MFDFLIDLIFPCRCVACGKYLDRAYLCRTCFNSLPTKKKFECLGCNQPTPAGKTCAFCKDSYAVDRLWVVSDYKDRAVARLVKYFKYRFLSDLAEPLGLLASKYINYHAKQGHFSLIQGNPLIVPVPLYKTREYWRGFNQAELLARLIARQYRLDFSQDLIRISQGTTQVSLKDRPERLSNVHGIYACSNPDTFHGREVILIDDVCTTGATFNECARVLKEAGAISVTALAIARG